MKNIFQTIEDFGDEILVRMTPIRVMLFGNVFLVLVLIILSNLQVLPLRLWDFIFFSVLFFLLALYRSGFVFALLVGMLPIETISLAPVEFGINLRPYQFFAVILFLAVLVRLVTKRIKWPLYRWCWQDIVMAVFLLSGFIMIPFLPSSLIHSTVLKQSFILLSFGLLYFLGRVFLKKSSDAGIAVSFFLSSIFVVVCYALWQNIRFTMNLPHFEVMPGRPNGTFPEADFFGGVLAAVVAGMTPFGLAFFFHGRASLARKFSFGFFLFFLFMILILTVARSGWLAAAIGIIVAGSVFFWRNGIVEALRLWNTEVLWRGVRGKLFIGVPILLATLTVSLFGLTNFNLLDRGGSIASGLQKITVSCSSDVMLPEKISGIEALDAYGCRHIDLEEIGTERVNGRFVSETFRDDPNISVRKNLYREAWMLIRDHPITGIGWGNTSHFFGTDGRGAGMNASNVFLEVWLGSGVFGFFAFMIFWFSFLILLMKYIIQYDEKDDTVIAISLIASFVAITVFNSFNSGLLLGSLWIFFSVLVWFSHAVNSKS